MDDEWHRLRLMRAKEHDLHCASVEFSDDSAIFLIDGVTDSYEVEINQNAQLWEVGISPTCTCEDHMWRRCICKHIAFALCLMGSDDDFLLSYCCWNGPEQDELYDWLSSAPSCVGCSNVLKHDGGNEFLEASPQPRDR